MPRHLQAFIRQMPRHLQALGWEMLRHSQNINHSVEVNQNVKPLEKPKQIPGNWEFVLLCAALTLPDCLET